MILIGYIDESYNHHFFTLSCLLARPQDWMWMQSAWRKVLRDKNKELKRAGRPLISRFHAADCSSRKGEFDGWDVDEQIAFVKHLLSIFINHMSSMVAWTIPIDDFKTVFHEHQKDPLPQMYGVLTKFVMGQTVHEIESQGYKGAIERVKISFVHDRNSYDSHIHGAFDQLKHDPNFRGRESFTTVTSVGWESCIPLQAADLIAYEAFKDAAGRVAGRSRRRSFASILDSRSFGGRSKSFTLEALQDLRKSMESSKVP
jgi:hypothetical protein